METQVKSITKPTGTGESVSRAMGYLSRQQLSGVHIAPGAKLLRVGDNIARGIGKELMK